MSARRVRWSSQLVTALLIGAAMLASFGLGLCQPDQAKVFLAPPGPLKYVINQRAACREGAILVGGDESLQPVVEDLGPGAVTVTYDVPLLDLPKPPGALDAIEEGLPIILTPARLAQIRRNHPLGSGFDEQSWSDLVADLVGQPAGGPPKGGGPRAGKPGAGGPPGGKPEGALPEGGPGGRPRAGLWDLPQRRLLWELLKLASSPQLFLEFDKSYRPQVWGALTGKPVLAATGALLEQTGALQELLKASSGIQGLVLIKDKEGVLVPPKRAARITILGPGGDVSKNPPVLTDASGYFYWPLPEGSVGPVKYTVGLSTEDQPSELTDVVGSTEVTVAEGSWANVVIIAEESETHQKGLEQGRFCAGDAAGVVSALTGLLAGTAAGSIVPALSKSGLPLQTGAMWSPGRSVRAYYGIERALAPSWYDRSLKALGPANVVIEFWKYPVVSQPGRSPRGQTEKAYADLAKSLSDAARERYDRAKADADASLAELDRLGKIIHDTKPEDNAAAYKALVESEIDLRKEYRDRVSEAQTLAAVSQVQLDLCDLYFAKELLAMGPRGDASEAIWTDLLARYNGDGQLPDRPTRDDIDVLGSRVVQKLSDDTARADKLGVGGQVQDAGLQHLSYEGPSRRQEQQGYVRFVRVRLIGTGIPADEVKVATRLRPGGWGLSAGMVAGGEGSQAAVAGWWLYERLGLRLTAGGTFASDKLPGQLMLGVGVQVPVGGGGGSSDSTPSPAPAAPKAPAAGATTSGAAATAPAGAPKGLAPPGSAPVKPPPK